MSLSIEDLEQQAGFELVLPKTEESGSLEAFSIYERQIEQFPLLTKEQEVELAKTIEVGRTAMQSLESEDLSPDELVKLQEQAVLGDKAREQFINSNLRLAVAVARSYRTTPGKIDFSDLVQLGNQGVIKAVDEFDWRRGFKFSTFATNWIRNRIQKGLQKTSRTIYLPQIANSRLLQLNRLESIGHSDETILSYMQISARELSEARSIRALQPISFETPVQSSDNETFATLGDRVVDESAEEAFKRVEVVTPTNKIRDILGTLLSPSEFEVVERRFGLQSGVAESIRAIAATAEFTAGNKASVSSHTVEYREIKSLTKLRHPANRKFLRDIIISAGVTEQEWADSAACSEAPAELFFPNAAKSTVLRHHLPAKGEHPIKDFCNNCPVKQQCDDYAQANKIKIGVWGGRYTSNPS